jgi:hypothetical protein
MVCFGIAHPRMTLRRNRSSCPLRQFLPNTHARSDPETIPGTRGNDDARASRVVAVVATPLQLLKMAAGSLTQEPSIPCNRYVRTPTGDLLLQRSFI